MTTARFRLLAALVVILGALAGTAACTGDDDGREGGDARSGLAPLDGDPELAWRVELEGIAPNGYVIGSQLIVAMVNVNGEGGGRVVALDRGSGDLGWEAQMPGGSQFPLRVGDDGLLLQDGKIARMLDADSGEERWRLELHQGEFVQSLSETLVAAFHPTEEHPGDDPTYQWTAIDLDSGSRGSTIVGKEVSAFDEQLAVLDQGIVTIYEAPTATPISEPLDVGDALALELTDDELLLAYADRVDVRDRKGVVVASGRTATVPNADFEELVDGQIFLNEFGGSELLERRDDELVRVWTGQGDATLYRVRSEAYAVISTPGRVSIVNLAADAPNGDAGIALGPDVTIPTVSETRVVDGQLYLLEPEGQVSAHRLDDAGVVWEIAPGSRPWSAIVPGDGAVALMTWNGRTAIVELYR